MPGHGIAQSRGMSVSDARVDQASPQYGPEGRGSPIRQGGESKDREDASGERRRRLAIRRLQTGATQETCRLPGGGGGRSWMMSMFSLLTPHQYSLPAVRDVEPACGEHRTTEPGDFLACSLDKPSIKPDGIDVLRSDSRLSLAR